uniref:Uncharacterized protein n=1 Tax=viral metagenome TaxID=1070528 RepID=A0A6C0K3Z1_9ZZZZ
MIQKPIRDFLVENAIEERIPYFGRARLYTLPMKQLRRSPFQLPREVFHFVTAIYLIGKSGGLAGGDGQDTPTNNGGRTFELRINSYKQLVTDKDLSDISHQNNDRNNLLGDPVFLGMNTFMSLALLEEGRGSVEDSEGGGGISLLVEYAKISPEAYRAMHQNDIVLVSKQKETEIMQFRGNSP